MQGRVQDHPLYKHVEMVIERRDEIKDFAGATLAERRFLDLLKSRRGLRSDEVLKMLGEMEREPATSVLVMLIREDPESVSAVDRILGKIPHETLVFGRDMPWPPGLARNV